jgi:hypothetical protein
MYHLTRYTNNLAAVLFLLLVFNLAADDFRPDMQIFKNRHLVVLETIDDRCDIVLHSREAQTNDLIR